MVLKLDNRLGEVDSKSREMNQPDLLEEGLSDLHWRRDKLIRYRYESVESLRDREPDAVLNLLPSQVAVPRVDLHETAQFGLASMYENRSVRAEGPACIRVKRRLLRRRTVGRGQTTGGDQG